ncbi:hypothetical protein EPA93_44230 [Ktedonosporobacter rubrisoli]|uniref:Uncharacterized protein n=1 Tax=Ktedonosporobacter rubrisoli TaxID=2509675 RepID=A0A4P6K3I5_KTERU|nr:hypothetical protein [Ktedonosporobacter rubrisoli]QBD82605.1 hypothetical protein EPA93_44230 [Ktedonosporobacter rubrisoli]
MSEYQRYEFMTCDQPLTRVQLNAVNSLSSHIKATSTHALIEYHWGDFKHDPIKVLHKFFDGFLYWANWGSPELAFRFPHGTLPTNLIDGYDLEDFVTFTQHHDCDILDISFGEMEGPEEWDEYDLGSLISIRDELMDGDLRALYIVWLAGQRMLGDYDDEYEDDDAIDSLLSVASDQREKEDYEISVPPVPPNFAMLTAAQQALARLLQVPQELLSIAAQYSQASAPSATKDDFAVWVKLLPTDRCQDYLLRLAHNEPGLSRRLVKELRALNPDKSEQAQPRGKSVSYDTLLAESKALKARKEREERERQQAARLRHLQDVHDHEDSYWQQVNEAVTRGATSYDEAVRLLVDLRDAASQFQTSQEFQTHFSAWVRPLMRRPALVSRLQEQQFSLPVK